MLISARRWYPAGWHDCPIPRSRDSSKHLHVSPSSRNRAVASTLGIDSARSSSSGNVALPRHELSNPSEKIALISLPRHQNLRNRGCAACIIFSCSRADNNDREAAAVCGWTICRVPSLQQAGQQSETRNCYLKSRVLARRPPIAAWPRADMMALRVVRERALWPVRVAAGCRSRPSADAVVSRLRRRARARRRHRQLLRHHHRHSQLPPSQPPLTHHALE